MEGPVVLVGWTPGNAAALAQRMAESVTARHPGPLHHTCPTCGSIEHGRPSYDAPIAVSIAHAASLHLVAVSTAGEVGVDLEAAGAADLDWVRREALGKAHGTGIVAEPPGPAYVVDLEVPGHVAALAVLTTSDVAILRFWPAVQEEVVRPAMP